MGTDFIFREVVKNKNDEYYTPVYAIIPLLKYLKPGTTIWCPFDTKESFFVKVFQENGFKVIFTHLDTGNDFFETVVPDCDYIISNPPYSKKNGCVAEIISNRKAVCNVSRCCRFV